MAEFPQLPIHVQRWLSELSDLTPEEHGVYFMAIMHMWIQPDCGMPNDPEWLRKKLKIHPVKWRRLWAFLMPYMTEINGRLYQKTLSEERTYLRDKSDKGRRNARTRWERFHANILNNNDSDHATQHNVLDAPTPTPTLLEESKKEKSSPSGSPKMRGSRLPVDFVTPSAWLDDAARSRFGQKLPPADLATEALKFVNHFASAPGQKGIKLDWRKTWINWALSARGNVAMLPLARMAGRAAI